MTATDLHLVTKWGLAAPPAAVWEALTKPEDWPAWWRAVEQVELIEPGDANGLGAYSRFTWRTALPYRVRFSMRITRVEPMSVIEGWADGELSGVGRWTLTPHGEGTGVRYDWYVKSSSITLGCACSRRSWGRSSPGTTIGSWRGATRASCGNWRGAMISPLPACGERSTREARWVRGVSLH